VNNTYTGQERAQDRDDSQGQKELACDNDFREELDVMCWHISLKSGGMLHTVFEKS
jgi:hypothetical protein